MESNPNFALTSRRDSSLPPPTRFGTALGRLIRNDSVRLRTLVGMGREINLVMIGKG